MRIRVVVPTEGPPELLRPCLEALAAEGATARAMLVVSAVDGHARAAIEREARRVVPGLAVLAEPRAGASLARNRALAECGDDEVIAYLDDDSVVQPGWWAGLQAAWNDVGVDVAGLGGPIDVRIDGGRPAWLSDELLSAFSRLDYGERPIDVDLEVRALAGPNMSFRCGALRQAGGFDPTLGHAGSRISFGEEHALQRSLAHLGHRIRYDPRPRVWHVVDAAGLTRATVLRRRLYYGATLRGRRPATLAARRLAVTAAGAAAAQLRGDRTLAMTQAFRAAENAGVLAARVLVRR